MDIKLEPHGRAQHHIISFQDRHERIRSIADELDVYLVKKQNEVARVKSGGYRDAPDEDCRELHRLRGYCEQLRCDADGIKRGTDGAQGVREEVTNGN